MDDPLFAQVKRKLCVSYDDDDTNARIESDIMPNAEQEIKSLLGINDDGFSFEVPGTENMLYVAYCYYDFNDCIDDFESNYASQIARCREKWMVKQYVEEQKASSPDV